jgi:hypothetical protein
LEIVDKALKKDLPKSSSETAELSKLTPTPAWLQDECKAAQMLTGISLECAAQGIFVVKGEQLWAYASQLNQPAAQEIARVIASYWTSSAGKHQGKKSDLARFVRLGTDGGEYMLFATQLRGRWARFPS